MKKSLVWVALLGLLVVLDSCKKDDPAPAAPIVGTWALAHYVYTALPAGFTKYEGYKTLYRLGIETGYTFVFNSDGTYSRAFVVDDINYSANSIFDKGKYTLDGTSLKVSPNSTTDLTLIENYGGTPGTEFTVVNDITDTRMTLSVVATVYILPDSFDTTTQPTQADFKSVDCTVQMVFNKLNTNQ